MGARCLQKIAAVCLRLGQGLLVAKNHPVFVIVDSAENNHPGSQHRLVGLHRAGELLDIGVNAGRRVAP